MIKNINFKVFNFTIFIIAFLVSASDVKSPQPQLQIPEIIAGAAQSSGFSISDYYFKMMYSARSVVKKRREKITSRFYEVFIPSKQPSKRVPFPLVLLEKDG